MWAAQRLQHHQQAGRCHQAPECMENIAPPGLRTSAGVEHRLRMRDPRVQADFKGKTWKKSLTISESVPIISSDRPPQIFVGMKLSQAECPKHGVAATSHHDATLVATNTFAGIALGIRGLGNIT